MSGTNNRLPQYFQDADYGHQEFYQELLNRILREWFASDIGFFLPTLTNTDVATLIALVPQVQPCRIWFNSDLGKAQILVAPGIIETITSV